MERLEAMAAVNGSAWAVGWPSVRARSSRTTPSPTSGRRVATLEPTGIEIELARAHLLYGEWLRRAQATPGGARAPAPGARAVRATAGRRRSRTRPHRARGHRRTRPAAAGEPGHPELTAQELTVARLAAAGHTNAEIGATMFLSANTVDYHLRKVFQKLGISSRRQLADRLDVPR